MASLDDLIAQVSEPRVREQLKREWAEVRKTRRFGLVFDRHLPELVPLPKVTPRRGDLVAKKGESLTDRWRVLRVRDGVAQCLRPEGTADAGARFDWPMEELVVVRQFGEPIFPSLTPMDQLQNGTADAPWHCLIEADNYHALQLLSYLYAGQVDCIYIDPPYNTGARDWKYNNDYVDGNDAWRHSKWLSFMEKRLRLAERLLNPSNGVLIVTIDEHEVNHLGVLLEQTFPRASQQLVTIVINQKGVAQGRLSRAEEYAFFSFQPEALLAPQDDDLLSPADAKNAKRFKTPRWEWLLRGGTNSRRIDRDRLFFPIMIDPSVPRITEIGDSLPLDKEPDLSDLGSRRIAWPLRTDGSLGNWRVSPQTLRKLLADGFVRLGGFDEQRGTWTILYLGEKARGQLESGAIRVVSRDPASGSVTVEYTEGQKRNVKTVWHRGLHDSGNYGSTLLRNILGGDGSFSFPKSLYATRDAVASVCHDRPNALILDFFAGSGTTLNAVNLLNATDGGQRRCILVTNNEVAGDEAEAMRALGLQPGDEDWEAQGICRSVTWPRSKFTIRGQREDGTALPGDYLTGGTVERERPRRIVHIGFVDPAALNTATRKKQLVALLPDLPQNLVTADDAYLVSEDHPTSVLFDQDAATDWLDALAGQDHISGLFVVATTKSLFDQIKTEALRLLGPLRVTEEEKRPLAEGFPSNLAYFRLDFLDQDRVALKRAFREILPLLWLKSGAIGPRPELPADEPDPDFFTPAANPFAVLLDEGAMRPMLQALASRTDLHLPIAA